MRLAKAISDAGVCSRREAEKLILAGEVLVNGKQVTDPATNASETDIIVAGGKQLQRKIAPRLWTYYKPVGLITSHKDTHDRPTVFTELKGLPRVISVGRLDLNSEGLLLLTNSSKLARFLELPSSKIRRIYKVRAYGKPNHLLNIYKQKTLVIDDIIYDIEEISLLSSNGINSWFKVVLKQGKNREIRKIFAYYGLQVNRLIRTDYGPFALGKLNPGDWQEQKHAIFEKFLF